MAKEKILMKMKQISVIFITVILTYSFGLGTETMIMAIMGL